MLWFPAPGILGFERILDKIQRIWDENRRKKEQAHCAKSFIIIAIIVLLLSLFTSDSVCSRKGTAWSSLGLGEIQE